MAPGTGTISVLEISVPLIGVGITVDFLVRETSPVSCETKSFNDIFQQESSKLTLSEKRLKGNICVSNFRCLKSTD